MCHLREQLDTTGQSGIRGGDMEGTKEEALAEVPGTP